MDDIILTYNARKTILELAKDRGYSVPLEHKQVDLNTFRHLYNNKNCDMLFTKDDNKKLFIKFIQNNKVKPGVLREQANDIIEQYLNKQSELIFILKHKPNNSIIKIKKEEEFEICEFFSLDNLQFNITKHILVPNHTKINENELNVIMNKYKLKGKHQLPRISINDPVIKYYNYKKGDVIKIVRSSPTSFEYIYYRAVN